MGFLIEKRYLTFILRLRIAARYENGVFPWLDEERDGSKILPPSFHFADVSSLKLFFTPPPPPPFYSPLGRALKRREI